jgi:hypothetical protein
MGSAVYIDRGSGSGRQSVARLCKAIVANVNGIEGDTVWTVWTLLTLHRSFLQGGLEDVRPTNLKDGRRLFYNIDSVYI